MITTLVSWFQNKFISHQYTWFIELIILLLFLIGITMFRRYYTKKLETFTQKKNTSPWLIHYIQANEKPLFYFIWILGFTLMLDIVSVSFTLNTLPIFTQMTRKILFLALLLWGTLRYISRMEKHYLEDPSQTCDKTTILGFSKIAKAVFFILILLTAMQSLGISLSGVLAFGGITGAALAFAGKDLLANFFGGLIIYLDRPFRVGDYISSPDKSIEGTVEQIGWRLCRIRQFNSAPLFIPNSVFTTLSIENISQCLHRRIKFTIGLRYEDAPKIESVITAIKAMLRAHPGINQNAMILVAFSAFANSSLNIDIDCFSNTKEYQVFKKTYEDVSLKIIEIVKMTGADFAFPSRTLFIEQTATPDKK